MKVMLFIFVFLFLILRIVYYNMAKGRKLSFSIIKLFGDVHSFNVLFPLKYSGEEDIKVRKFKNTANLFLYLFLLSFIALLIYGLSTEFLN